MAIARDKTVRDLLAEVPAAHRVFEEAGIDYCCGGEQTFEMACSKAHVSAAEVEQRIAEALETATPTSEVKNWHAEPLADLVSHIIETHHAFTRREMARLAPLMGTVAQVHGKDHPELLRIQAIFEELSPEMNLHMMKEEEMFFPYIAQIEEAALEGRPVISTTFSGVKDPVRAMMQEHDSTGAQLRAIREASADYLVPPGGCFSYQSLYEGFRAFEQDMHQHIHLENNILFPRALQMEGYKS